MSNDYFGKIYAVISPTGQKFIGSTNKDLSKTMAIHERHYRQYKRGRYRYMSLFSILENGEYEIKLIEDYRCNSGKELKAREQKIIRANDCVNIDHRKQYYEDNRERIRERDRQYQQKKRKLFQQKFRSYNTANTSHN